MIEFTIGDVRVGGVSDPDNVAPSQRLVRYSRYLKGPIPWAWLSVAAKCPGRALHVALVVWHLHGLERSMVVKMSGARLRELGVDRHAASRGLRALEARGLVSVLRHKGRSAVVTINEVAS